MQVTRRGFLQTAIVGIAAAAISWRLSQAPVRLTEEQRYTWEQPNPDYSYGIDKEHPWDVVILDEKRGEFMTPDELKGRGELEWLGRLPEDAGSNTYDDDIDRAFGAYAAVVISQGYIGWEEAGKPGFDAPMKEIDEDVDARIYTTSREFYADS
jgi:hypothetical protein